MEIITTTKITNRDGIKAIRNGQKFNKYSDIPTPKKPSWLKLKAEFNPNFHKVKEQVQSKQLYTVCEEAHCPNISECWSAGTPPNFNYSRSTQQSPFQMNMFRRS